MCCAQFMASREAIRSIPLEFWKAYSGHAERAPENNISFVDAGMTYEHTWHVIFHQKLKYNHDLAIQDRHNCYVKLKELLYTT